MRSVSSLLVVTGTMFALALLAPSLPAAADSPHPILINKECHEFTGNVPSFCTITDSNFSAIPAGTKVFYWGPEISDPDYTSSVVIINTGRGNRATGYCSLLGQVGTCSFWEGTGTLRGFHAAFQVTYDGGPNYTWTGTYRLDKNR
ncbi:MAG TPA: hypothetical protein VL086_18555 [Candidatus Nitrosotalea sp.]|nr:hypothetical protein [Candidatus Nitrosotalea sp.]